MSISLTLLPALTRIAKLQNEPVDLLAVQEALSLAGTDAEKNALENVVQQLQLPKVRWLVDPDPADVPALVYSPEHQWGVLRGQNAHGQWVVERWNPEHQQWRESTSENLSGEMVALLSFIRLDSNSKSPTWQLIRNEVFSHKRAFFEAIIGGGIINTVALATSFYAMQVYDRVVPTGASQTLLVLTLGMVGAVIYELFAKRVRSRLYDYLIDQIDQRLARTIYRRFLAIRMDQLPKSVGGLAAQMRGYETVRGFLVGVTTHLLVDAPFALLFALMIALIAGWLAVIPLAFFVLCIAIGRYYQGRVEVMANKANAASNLKTGLLVETVEGAETIKSGQAGWRMLSRWMSTTDEARDYELSIRRVSEHSQYLVAAFQQFSYILLVASGALLVSKGELTLGALIACSMLSGRILAPVATIPGQLVQWAHTKAALNGLDKLWSLEDDHEGCENPISLERITGHYRLDNVAAEYSADESVGMPALAIDRLVIHPGEKVGVIGPVGAGKTTLLRLLSGMYKPQVGRIFLDDLDLMHLSKPLLAEQIGFVQQDGRLFSGTLRDNLILGMLDVGDDKILQASRQTGLLDSVIAPHPQGLQQPIYEGGSGLSGGQRQLVNLTRAFLRHPKIWLLDEPTASMDHNLEKQVTGALRESMRGECTLVLVTHKPTMLELVDRIIVIADHRVAMDGPRDKILQQLQAPIQQQTVDTQEWASAGGGTA